MSPSEDDHMIVLCYAIFMQNLFFMMLISTQLKCTWCFGRLII